MNAGERFKQVQKFLGLSVNEIAQKLDISRDTWHKYTNGFLPNGTILQRIAELGFSTDWLLTGRGDMMAGSQSHSVPVGSTAQDPVLLGRIIDGISAVYRDEGARIADIHIGRLAAPIYADLLMIEDETEQRGALQYALTLLRKDLRRAATDPGSSKLQA